MRAVRFLLLFFVLASVGACTSDPAASDAPTNGADMTPAATSNDTSAVAERVDSAGPVPDMPQNVRSEEYSAPPRKTTTTGNQ
ncbi:hypothetical protein [Hymenobacter qilianensis]|uniref:hypothetical protein n=1 Tax=Hymenobacter qilianensis TaxID=1385715 RepID=UPI001E5EC38F|nr:hypothetical protein [Hymenobacter qilianensis]